MNHKPINMLIWTILVGISALTAHGAGPFASGTGEPNDPFQIETAQQLLAMGKDPNLLDKHFIPNNDINMDPNGPNGQIVIGPVIGTREGSIIKSHSDCSTVGDESVSGLAGFQFLGGLI